MTGNVKRQDEDRHMEKGITIKLERKEIYGMTQNKMFRQVLEEIKKRRRS
jgi:hypothetical protein